MVDQLVTPKNHTSKVWKYFSLPKGLKCVTPLPQSSERAQKLTHAVCKMIARDIRPSTFSMTLDSF